MSCEYKESDRSGLYIMVLIAMLGSCNSCEKLDEQDKKIENIEKKLDHILKLERIENSNTVNQIKWKN